MANKASDKNHQFPRYLSTPKRKSLHLGLWRLTKIETYDACRLRGWVGLVHNCVWRFNISRFSVAEDVVAHLSCLRRAWDLRCNRIRVSAGSACSPLSSESKRRPQLAIEFRLLGGSRVFVIFQKAEGLPNDFARRI